MIDNPKKWWDDDDKVMHIMMLSLSFMCIAMSIGIVFAIIWTVTL